MAKQIIIIILLIAVELSFISCKDDCNCEPCNNQDDRVDAPNSLVGTNWWAIENTNASFNMFLSFISKTEYTFYQTDNYTFISNYTYNKPSVIIEFPDSFDDPYYVGVVMGNKMRFYIDDNYTLTFYKR